MAVTGSTKGGSTKGGSTKDDEVSDASTILREVEKKDKKKDKKKNVMVNKDADTTRDNHMEAKIIRDGSSVVQQLSAGMPLDMERSRSGMRFQTDDDGKEKKSKLGTIVSRLGTTKTPAAGGVVSNLVTKTGSMSNQAGVPRGLVDGLVDGLVVAKTTHQYDAIVPVYWSHHQVEQDELVKKREMEEEAMEMEEKKEAREANEKKRTHEETTKQSAALAGIAAATSAAALASKGGGGGLSSASGSASGSVSEKGDDKDVEIPYIVETPWAKKKVKQYTEKGDQQMEETQKETEEETEEETKTEEVDEKEEEGSRIAGEYELYQQSHSRHHHSSHSGGGGGGGSGGSAHHQESSTKYQRWDERKAAEEAKRHEWQRSPYVCPLSTMKISKYPDEFGAHQGTLENPDAYRRAMLATVAAAEHVASSTNGHDENKASNEPPSMAYAPDISAKLVLSDPEEVTYQPIMSHFFSDIDGRAKYAVMGSPGADMGEFLLAVSCFESAAAAEGGMAGSRVDDGLAYRLMSTFLEDMVLYGKTKFAYVTDESAVDSWTRSAEVTDALRPMTPDGKSRVISTSSLPGSIGSQHLKHMMESPDQYRGLRPKLLATLIECFFTIYFDSTHPSQPSLMLIVNKGKHEEKGLVVVDRTGMYPEACKSLTPLIVPDTGHQSYYVYHRAAADQHRSSMAEWMMQTQHWAETHLSMGNRLYEDIKRLATKWFDSTKDHIGRGLPRYRVAFGKD